LVSFGARRQQYSKIVPFIGRKAGIWMILAIAGTLVLALVELGIAYFIPLFLASLGIMDKSVTASLPFYGANIPIWVVSVSLLGLGAFRFLGQYLVNHSGMAVLEHISTRLRRVLIYHMLLDPRQGFTAASLSNYYLGSIFTAASTAVLLTTVSIAQLLQSMSLAVVMLSISWKEALLSIAGLGCIGLLVRQINYAITAKAVLVPAETKKLVSGIERVARNWLLIRILKTQKIEHDRFSKSISDVCDHSLKSAFYSDIAGAGTPFFGVILLTLIVFVSHSYFFTAGSVLISFLYVFIRFVQGLSATVSSATQTSRYLPQLKEAFCYFSSFTEEQIKVALLEGPRHVEIGALNPKSNEPHQCPDIRIENVSFRYDQTDILQNLSLHIPAGSTFGIIGPSGSGKSTLLLLLLGVHQPQEGRVLVAGQNAASVLRNEVVNIGYVGPEPFLFEGTIRENLSYGLTQVDEKSLWDALAAASLKETIQAMPMQLEHALSENGDGLSAGQKQRLCLARIFLRRPSLVILDEATANLDSRTEMEVVDSLARLKDVATIIIVTHRMTTLRHADYIFDMERKKVEHLSLSKHRSWEATHPHESNFSFPLTKEGMS
jgi:ABC-type multidrug transport system fused ATPase/permease subunit